MTLISLPRSPQEFQKSAPFFYSIIRIEKVINSISTHLVHGTSSPAHQKLVTYQGFYHSSPSGGLIGDKIYFAVHANHSTNDLYVLKFFHIVENYSFVKFYRENSR